MTANRDFSGLGGPDFGERELTGDDIGYGYTASAHWNVLEDWSLGARFQSRVDLELEGDMEFDSNPVPPNNTKFDVEGEITLPASVNFGVANNSIDKLHLGLDFVWTEWSTYDQLAFVLEPGYPTTLVTPNPDATSKRWKNVWSIRAGADYQLLESLALRAGYVWDQSPVNGDTRSPEMPGSDRQMVMAGLGWKWKGVGIDLAYSYLWAKKADTGSEVVSKVSTLAGEYETDTHLVSLSVGFAF